MFVSPSKVKALAKFAAGWIKLFLIPVGVGIGLVAVFVHPVADFDLYVATTSLFVVVLLYYFDKMSQRVKYRTEIIETLDLSEVPPEIRELITRPTREGYFINRAMILSFSGQEKLSITKLHNRIRREGIRLTQQAVRPYIDTLVEKGFVENPETPYEKELSLTKRGKWCRNMTKLILPNSYFMFVLRNEIGLRPKITEFDDADVNGESPSRISHSMRLRPSSVRW